LLSKIFGGTKKSISTFMIGKQKNLKIKTLQESINGKNIFGKSQILIFLPVGKNWVSLNSPYLLIPCPHYLLSHQCQVLTFQTSKPQRSKHPNSACPNVHVKNPNWINQTSLMLIWKDWTPNNITLLLMPINQEDTNNTNTESKSYTTPECSEENTTGEWKASETLSKKSTLPLKT